MQGIREIKRRIRSTKSTRQITRAMKMEAAARLRRAQERVIAARPYAAKIEEIFRHVARHKLNLDDPLFQPHVGGNRVCYIVIAADRGLCGGYNANVIRKAMVHSDLLDKEWQKEQPEAPPLEFSFVTVGKKVREFLSFRRFFILRDWRSAGDLPTIDLTRRLTDDICQRFLRGEVDRVYLVYSEFVSVMNQRPVVQQLLPLSVPKDEAEAEAEKAEAGANPEEVHKVEQKDRREGGDAETGSKQWVPDYVMEPSPEVIFAKLIPHSIEVRVLQALLEGRAGEYGARMTAMENATKNADEMIDRYTLSYNRARQAAITQEISELIGGVEAAKA